MSLLRSVYIEELVEERQNHNLGFAFLEIGIFFAGLAFVVSFFNSSLSMIILWIDIAYFSLILIVVGFSNDPVHNFDPVIALISFTSVGGLVYLAVDSVNPSASLNILFFVGACDFVVLVFAFVFRFFYKNKF